MLRYGLIRALPPRAMAAPLVLAWVGAALAGRGGALPSGVDPGGAGRVAVFGTLGGLLLALFVWRAAAAGRDLCARDRAWLLPQPTPPGLPLVAFAAGQALAWTLAVALLVLGAEAGAGGESATRRQGPALPGPDLVVLGPEAPTAGWVVEDAGGRLPDTGGISVVARALAGAGPSAALTLELTRGGTTTRATHRIAGARRVDAPLPAGDGDLTLRLVHDGVGAPLALAAAEARAHAPAGGPAPTGLGLGLHLWLLGLGATGLALGLGARLRPLLAALGVLALGLVPPLVGEGAGLAWLPGTPGAWLRALSAAGEGWVPAWPGAAVVLGALLGLALGVVGTRAGLTGGPP